MAPSRVDDDGAGAVSASSKNVSELQSKWPDTYDLRGSNLPCRLEGEVADLVVLGTVPPEIDGTFYRVSLGSQEPVTCACLLVKTPSLLKTLTHRS